ncbi:hypothetical protein D3C59_18110 [Streptomyces sp. SHP22-7]|nr:hypothetical protein D3C59_18110 [Streptomyces sp. SHP22-7]
MLDVREVLSKSSSFGFRARPSVFFVAGPIEVQHGPPVIEFAFVLEEDCLIRINFSELVTQTLQVSAQLAAQLFEFLDLPLQLFVVISLLFE